MGCPRASAQRSAAAAALRQQHPLLGWAPPRSAQLPHPPHHRPVPVIVEWCTGLGVEDGGARCKVAWQPASTRLLCYKVWPRSVMYTVKVSFAQGRASFTFELLSCYECRAFSRVISGQANMELTNGNATQQHASHLQHSASTGHGSSPCPCVCFLCCLCSLCCTLARFQAAARAPQRVQTCHTCSDHLKTVGGTQ